MPPSFKKWTEEDEKKLLEGVQQGKTFEDLGKELERSTGACVIRVKQIAVKLLESGEPLEEVARKTKLSEKEVKEQQEIKKRKKEKKKKPAKQDLGLH